MKIIIKRREETSVKSSILASIVLLLLAVLIYLSVFSLAGVPPTGILETMWDTLTSKGNLIRSLQRGLPILLPALGLIVVFKMGLWNIGAEGQLLMGLLAGSGIGIYLAPNLPGFLAVLLMLLTAFVAGGAWAFIPAYLRATIGANEILVTLMFNYVAVSVFNYVVAGPWRDPHGYGFIKTPMLDDKVRLSIYDGIALSILIALAIFLIMKYTKFGYEVRLMGANPVAARSAGVDPLKTSIIAMFISGGLAGIGGVMISSIITGVLMEAQSMSPGYGYTAIIAAWLARLDPWGTILSSFFLGYLMETGESLKIAYGLPASGVMVLEGLFLLAVAATVFFEKYTIEVKKTE